MTRTVSARALAGSALLAVTISACGSTATGAVPTASPVASPAAVAVTPSPTIAATPVPTASPSPAPTSTIYDTTSVGTDFDLPMTIDLPSPWKALPPLAGAFVFVHTGTPPEDTAQWFGPNINLVDGAWVADPADIAKAPTHDDAKLPWPASYIDYFTALPGVSVVDGPDEVTIGGAKGRRVVVKAPGMHPTIFLKDDTTWLGGFNPDTDSSYVGLNEIIELDVQGTPVLIEYPDSLEKFAEHRVLVDKVFESITFPKAGS